LVYSTIESKIARENKLKCVYEIILQKGAVNLQLPNNVYVYIPKVDRVDKVYQVQQDKEFYDTQVSSQQSYTVIKVNQGSALLGVVVQTTYMPLWAIILIVALSAVVIGIAVTIFIIVRRKTKEKYSRYDKI